MITCKMFIIKSRTPERLKKDNKINLKFLAHSLLQTHNKNTEQTSLFLKRATFQEYHQLEPVKTQTTKLFD